VPSAPASRSSQATERPRGDKRVCSDAGSKVDPRRTSRPPCRLLRIPSLRADVCLQRNAKIFKPADKRRSLGTEACRPESKPSSLPCSESKRTPMRPAVCPHRVSRRPGRPPTVARNWNFESSSLQWRVNKLSVRVAIVGDREQLGGREITSSPYLPAGKRNAGVNPPASCPSARPAAHRRARPRR
jgi:hypothetical protein